MENSSSIPQFSRVAKNVLRIINTIASIWRENTLAYLVLGYYLPFEAQSVPRATLSENCSLLGTDNFRKGYCLYIFAPKGLAMLIELSNSSSCLAHVQCKVKTSHTSDHCQADVTLSNSQTINRCALIMSLTIRIINLRNV